MAEKIKKNWDLAIIFGAGTVLVIAALFAAFPNPVFSDVSNSIVVTATVQPYLTFTSSATSTTLTPDMVDNSGIAHVASSTNVTLTVGTSAASGFSITENDSSHGLATGTSAIYSNGATSTITAGINGFGIQATSTSVTSVASQFAWPFTGTTVGNASSTAVQTIASNNASGINKIVTIRFLAAATTSMPAGSYQDTITLTATPSY